MLQVLPLWSKFKNKEEVVEELVLIPLIEAYEIIKEDVTATTSENNITRKIYKNVKKNSSISSHIGKQLIDVSCKPEEEGSDDNITEPDIKFFIATVCTVWIEAKRIYRGDSVSEYCGDRGLRRFISGYYSHQGNIDGMIAYIQRGCISDIQNEIIERVRTCNCSGLAENIGINASFVSFHKRNSTRDIKIYHLFFDFVIDSD